MSRQHRIGIMTVDVEQADSDRFNRLVQAGVKRFENRLDSQTELAVETFAFEGPHINAAEGGYSALDFMQLGIAERAERNFSFLLVITEVDLSSTTLTYSLAMPSQLTNVAILTTKRLSPTYWGKSADEGLAAERLATLMMHAFGKLLNLDDSQDPANVMHPIQGVESLDAMERFTDTQRQAMRKALPRESFDQSAKSNRKSFAISTVFKRFPAILRAMVQANPFRLVTKLPTMLATALSVIVVLIFAAETWDFAGAVAGYKMTVFAVLSFAAACFVLYRAFAFNTVVARDGRLMESTVVTSAATALSLLATIVVMFIGLALAMYALTWIFPEVLMVNWSSVDPVTSLSDHISLAVFLASIGVLAGSLGGAADSRNLIRNVLFVTSEA